MTEEEILKQKQLEEEQNAETLPASEESADVELNSEPEPTVEQQVEADLITPESEGASEAESSETIQSEVLTPEQESVEKMLTQSQVDEIVGRTRTETRDKTMQGFYGRYGVDNEAGMDELVGKSQKYDLLRDDYDHVSKELADCKVKLALMDSGIAPERYEDAKLILTGKGLEVTPENITLELETHPEWKKVMPSLPAEDEEVKEVFVKKEETPAPSVISVLGNEASPKQVDTPSERESAMKMFR